MNYKLANKIFMICLFGGAAVGVIAAQAQIMWLSAASIAVMIAGIAVKLIFYRCPHCGKWLGRDSGEYCRNCGKKLE